MYIHIIEVIVSKKQQHFSKEHRHIAYNIII